MTGDLDLRGNKIIFPSEFDMDRKLIKMSQRHRQVIKQQIKVIAIIIF